MSELTIEYRTDGFSGPEYRVYEFGVYDRNSVLVGQTKKTFRGSYDTAEEALAAFPDAELGGYRDAHNTFNHLPGEDDPVPGGMYPDDIDDGY